jgi:hypothetical protein
MASSLEIAFAKRLIKVNDNLQSLNEKMCEEKLKKLSEIRKEIEIMTENLHSLKIIENELAKQLD